MLIGATCKKEAAPPQDPFATLNNQLVCNIDGNKWSSAEVFGGLFFVPPDRKYLFLDCKNGYQRVEVFINPPFTQGVYILNKNTLDYPITIYPENYMEFLNYYPDLTPEDKYITNAIETGTLEFLNFDTINFKFRAKFSFTGKDQRTGKKVTVTDGYFDYHQ